jgi:hypothetical protein
MPSPPPADEPRGIRRIRPSPEDRARVEAMCARGPARKGTQRNSPAESVTHSLVAGVVQLLPAAKAFRAQRIAQRGAAPRSRQESGPRRPACVRRSHAPRRPGRARRACRRGPPSDDEGGEHPAGPGQAGGNESHRPRRLAAPLRELHAQLIARSAALGREPTDTYVARVAGYVEADDPALLPALYEAAALAKEMLP